jgi:hypothetical protein
MYPSMYSLGYCPLFLSRSLVPAMLFNRVRYRHLVLLSSIGLRYVSIYVLSWLLPFVSPAFSRSLPDQ